MDNEKIESAILLALTASVTGAWMAGWGFEVPPGQEKNFELAGNAEDEAIKASPKLIISVLEKAGYKIAVHET